MLTKTSRRNNDINAASFFHERSLRASNVLHNERREHEQD